MSTATKVHTKGEQVSELNHDGMTEGLMDRVFFHKMWTAGLHSLSLEIWHQDALW